MKTEGLSKSHELRPGIQKNGSRTRLMVDNIKCGSCTNTFTKTLNELNFKGVALKAKSYLSCTLGKIS